MKRSSKAHSKGCFAKNFYDLPLANLLHPGECLESSILPADLKLARVKRSSKAHSKGCFVKNFYDLPLANLLHPGECLGGHSSKGIEEPEGEEKF